MTSQERINLREELDQLEKLIPQQTHLDSYDIQHIKNCEVVTREVRLIKLFKN